MGWNVSFSGTSGRQQAPCGNNPPFKSSIAVREGPGGGGQACSSSSSSSSSSSGPHLFVNVLPWIFRFEFPCRRHSSGGYPIIALNTGNVHVILDSPKAKPQRPPQNICSAPGGGGQRGGGFSRVFSSFCQARQARYVLFRTTRCLFFTHTHRRKYEVTFIQIIFKN